MVEVRVGNRVEVGIRVNVDVAVDVGRKVAVGVGVIVGIGIIGPHPPFSQRPKNRMDATRIFRIDFVHIYSLSFLKNDP
jgi:hypothetical protein